MADLKDLCVLVVEDDDFQRRLLVSMLQSLGVSSIHGAQDGQQAIEILRQENKLPIDVILSDLNMPTMDGLEFLRRIGEEGHHVSISIISGMGTKLLASAASMAKALEIRILDVVEKPVQLDRLKNGLSRYERTARIRSHPVAIPNFHVDEIEEGVRENQFRAYFQPKVDLRSGRVIGGEALARWIHPKLGVVGPNSFIPQLERNGTIDELTFNMFQQCAMACRRLQSAGFNLVLSLNLSLVSLDDHSLVNRILQSVKDIGLHPRWMVFEISETAAMNNVVYSSENLARLCMNGFSLSIDDYGTGYSNMQQLTRIPFSELKIDQSFVTGFSANQSLRIVVESIIDMANRLGLQTVAEGVETQADWDALKDIGCNAAQGYFIAQPMELDQFEEFLAAARSN